MKKKPIVTKKKVTSVHVLPIVIGKYKNGKERLGWVVKTNVELDEERKELFTNLTK